MTPPRSTGSSTEQVSLFERVPENKKLGWSGIAAILSGVVSSLTKLMGGGIVAFYAGCTLGLGAALIMFVLSIVLTNLVGRIAYREGLPSNVTSRLYVFGTKGSALDSIIWIFLLVGVLAIGTVQLGNAILYYLGWTDPVLRDALFVGISLCWILISLFGMKIIARFNLVFVALLFVALLFVAGSIAVAGDLGDAFTHGPLMPGVSPMEGFFYAVNYSIMTSGLMALFSSDFTRFARKESDVTVISVVGSVFAVLTYVFGALLAYYGFDVSFDYFLGLGYDAAGAANAAITNPGITFVLSLGLAGLIIICLSQLKVEASNSISSSNAISNLFDSLFGIQLPWPVAVVAVNVIGLAFIFGNILDQVNAFMSFGSILTMSWCFLLITDYYIVRGKLHIGSQGIVSLKYIEAVNWRGLITITVSTAVSTVLYANGVLPVPCALAAPLTIAIYVSLSLIMRKKVRENDRIMREREREDGLPAPDRP
ncbi:MAG: cytosine/purine permease NCS1 family protein [Eggerthellaceae bacterium]|nr:cytosine/purine permease NCS1 family protein [Eggerthellaceae bacterium]